MHEEGARLVHEYGITDPTPAIVRALGDYLRRAYAVTLAPEPLAITVLTGEDPTQLTAAYPSADLILDVETTSWGLARLHEESPGCRVQYRARLRIIDAKTVQPLDGKRGSVIADGTCVRAPHPTRVSPHCKEFLADGARQFKSELETLVRWCIDELRSKLLTQPAP
jgi:hypothetical protein